jgi:carbon storage regulator
MLVLSRKPGEEIVIGGDIRVKVVEVRGNRVRLAFAAPAEIAIHRGDILPPKPAVEDLEDEFSVVLVGS